LPERTIAIFTHFEKGGRGEGVEKMAKNNNKEIYRIYISLRDIMGVAIQSLYTLEDLKWDKNPIKN
jgi:hypothetical protein